MGAKITKKPAKTQKLKAPTPEEYRAYDGAHCFTLWASLPETWRCPGCSRTKFELLRWTKRYRKKDHETGKYAESYWGWMAGLHVHHDHGADHLWREFFDKSESHQQWHNRYTLAMRFPETVICDQCNSADGRAKRALEVPADFSFSPEEIRRFVVPTPHGPHRLDLEEASRIFRGLRG